MVVRLGEVIGTLEKSLMNRLVLTTRCKESGTRMLGKGDERQILLPGW